MLSAVLPLHVDDWMKTGELFATVHTTQVFLNQVTGGTPIKSPGRRNTESPPSGSNARWREPADAGATG
jgi:hypothetical protein